MREMADEKARAERARQRFEARTARLQQEKEQREQELAQQKARALHKGPDAVREILERNRSTHTQDDET
jgi:electron transport complex protein RnfC